MLRYRFNEFEVLGPSAPAAMMGPELTDFLSENPAFIPAGETLEQVKAAKKDVAGEMLFNSPMSTQHGLPRNASCNYAVGLKHQLSMLDAAAPGPGGKITIPASKSTGSPGNFSRNKVRSRLKADRRAADTRRIRDRRVIKLTTDAFDTGANSPQPPASASLLDQGSSLTRRGGSQ